MEEIVHKIAAKLYFEIAESKNNEYEKEVEINKRTAIRVVAAQNYFYAIVNAIEAILATKEEHSFNHENRRSKIHEYRNLFSEEVVDLYSQIERDQRNKVTYRDQNGIMYENIKKLAKLLHRP